MQLKNKNIITIDATSTVSGGGVTYLYEFLRHSNKKFIFNVICSQKIAQIIIKKENINIISHPFLNKNIFFRLFFQFFLLDRYINKKSLMLISLSGDYLGGFRPYIGVCQNMLLYEREKRKGMTLLNKVKLEILRKRQIRSFNNSSGTIFLSEFAKKKVTPILKNKNSRVINFGISNRFFLKKEARKKPKEPYKFLYISSIHTYKKQLSLINSFEKIKSKNIDFHLSLVGSVIDKNYWKKVQIKINEINKEKEYISYTESIDFLQIDFIYKNHDIFIFPSICENMPNIVIEAMASGIPILSSDNNPMPEFLKSNAIYFNSEDEESITKKILYSMKKYELLLKLSKNNLFEAKNYTWRKNFSQTIKFINTITKNV